MADGAAIRCAGRQRLHGEHRALAHRPARVASAARSELPIVAVVSSLPHCRSVAVALPPAAMAWSAVTCTKNSSSVACSSRISRSGQPFWITVRATSSRTSYASFGPDGGVDVRPSGCRRRRRLRFEDLDLLHAADARQRRLHLLGRPLALDQHARLHPPAGPQFVRRALRDDPPAGDDDRAVADRFHLRQDVRREHHGVVAAEVLDRACGSRGSASGPARPSARRGSARPGCAAAQSASPTRWRYPLDRWPMTRSRTVLSQQRSMT